MNATIYHNPRCSKSRQTLQLLHDKGCEVEIIEYLKNPPELDKIKQILNMLDITPRDLMRKNESAYKELQLDDDSLSDQTLIEAMYKNPILIERPIVIANNKAAIGRPPESVLEIL